MLSRVRRRRAGVHRRPAAALSQCVRTVLAMCWLGPFAGGGEVVLDPVDGLLEREVVTASAGELVGRVAAGGTGALFVIGEAGLGKTSVIDSACRLAGRAGLAVGLGRGRNGQIGISRAAGRRSRPDTPPGTPGRVQEIGGTDERDM